MRCSKSTAWRDTRSTESAHVKRRKATDAATAWGVTAPRIGSLPGSATGFGVDEKEKKGNQGRKSKSNHLRKPEKEVQSKQKKRKNKN